MAGVPVDLTDDAMTDLLTTTIAAVALAVLIRPEAQLRLADRRRRRRRLRACNGRLTPPAYRCSPIRHRHGLRLIHHDTRPRRG